MQDFRLYQEIMNGWMRTMPNRHRIILIGGLCTWFALKICLVGWPKAKVKLHQIVPVL